MMQLQVEEHIFPCQPFCFLFLTFFSLCHLSGFFCHYFQLILIASYSFFLTHSFAFPKLFPKFLFCLKFFILSTSFFFLIFLCSFLFLFFLFFTSLNSFYPLFLVFIHSLSLFLILLFLTFFFLTLLFFLYFFLLLSTFISPPFSSDDTCHISAFEIKITNNLNLSSYLDLDLNSDIGNSIIDTSLVFMAVRNMPRNYQTTVSDYSYTSYRLFFWDHKEHIFKWLLSFLTKSAASKNIYYEFSERTLNIQKLEFYFKTFFFISVNLNFHS